MAAVDDIATLNDRLDALWVRYLNFLDEYTIAQAIVKKDMAAGFFSLTQANFKSTGRRYGHDHYDDRAKATTRIGIESDGDSHRLKVIETSPEAPLADDADATKEDGSSREQCVSRQLLSPSPTPDPDSKGDPDEQHTSHEEDQAEHDTHPPAKPKVDTHDPIRWFGILIPPALRQAQVSFRNAVRGEHGIGQAANTARGLRETEAEIRKLRKLLRKAERDSSPKETAEN